MGVDVIESKNKTARKSHHCDYCGEIIKKGEEYSFQKNIFDGSFYEWHTHLSCSRVASAIWDYVDPDDGMSGQDFTDVNPEKIYVDDDCYYQQSDDVLLLMNKEADRIGYSGKYATAKLCVDDSSIDRGYWSLEEMTLGLTWADAWCRIPPDPDQEESV